MNLLLAELPPPRTDPGHVSAVVHRIVSHPPYVRPGPSSFERARDYLLDHLVRLLSVVGGSGIGAWIVVAVVAALLHFSRVGTSGTTRRAI